MSFIQSKPENVSSLDLAAMIESVGKLTTNNFMTKIYRGEVSAVNASSILVRETFGKYL
jgi:hypothetical protein